jgi:cysteine desulfurase
VLPSHVVSALGMPDSLARSLIRFSLGRDSSMEDVDILEQILPAVIHRAQHPEKGAKSR